MVPGMTNDWTPNDDRRPSPADSAFVVHLMATEVEPPEIVRGRIEHISSGQWTRFASVTELIEFMRHYAGDRLTRHRGPAHGIGAGLHAARYASAASP